MQCLDRLENTQTECIKVERTLDILRRFQTKNEETWDLFEQAYEEKHFNIEESLETWKVKLKQFFTRDRVAISTIHNFKGGERSVVFIVDAKNTTFPFKEPGFRENYEGSIRLLYTAITRAKHELYFINCLTVRGDTCDFLDESLEKGAIKEVTVGPAKTKQKVNNKIENFF